MRRHAARCAEDVPPSATGSFMRGLMPPRSLNRLWPHLRRNLWSVFGSDACCELVKTYKKEDTRCLDMICMAADIADACLRELYQKKREQSK